ncbi:MAG: hypothetical protein NVS2B12_06130 [Ktedonobacteraceae bacterium]
MAQYTREQLIRLTVLSSDVVMATLLIDETDRVGLMREFHNATKFIEDTKEMYPQNVLIQNMATSIDASMQDIRSYNLTQRRTVENAYRQRINEAVRLLNNDAETLEYKHALLELAQKVAEAAGHGIFGTGEKVSKEEKDFLQALRRTLGIAPA